MLFFYRILINLVLLLSPIIILFRIIKKKEHPTRFLEKLGISSSDGRGYRALANISDYGGQEVPHLHFHLFGGERVGKMVEWAKKLKEII